LSEDIKQPVSVEELLENMREELDETHPAEEGGRRSRKRGRSARHVAMDVLAHRDHSRLELEEKLNKKLSNKIEDGEISAEDIACLLDELTEDGLLDEARYAESFVNGRVRKGQGPVRIRRDLNQKGLPRHLLQQAFDAADVNWRQRAGEVRRKKFGNEAPQDYKERARQARFLQYRGFSNEQIQSALGESYAD
jgi:regulatory protein